MNGAVATAGAKVGVPTPVNAKLAALVDDVAEKPERRQWFVRHPRGCWPSSAEARSVGPRRFCLAWSVRLRRRPRHDVGHLYFAAMQTADFRPGSRALVAGFLVGGIPFGIIVPA